MTVLPGCARSCYSCTSLSPPALKVAPDEFVEKYESLQKLKKIKSVVNEVKEMAKEVAAKEAALDF